MIEYSDSSDLVTKENFRGFFENWSIPPSLEKQLEIINNSSEIIIALDTKTKKIVGFINALTDGVMYSFIPLLEVLPNYKNQGIGKELLTRMINKLSDMYAIDLCCDSYVEGFYQKLGFFKVSGMVKRNFEVLK